MIFGSVKKKFSTIIIIKWNIAHISNKFIAQAISFTIWHRQFNQGNDIIISSNLTFVIGGVKNLIKKTEDGELTFLRTISRIFERFHEISPNVPIIGRWQLLYHITHQYKSLVLRGFGSFNEFFIKMISAHRVGQFTEIHLEQRRHGMNILEHGFVIIQIRHSIFVKGNPVIKNDND